MSQVRLPGLVYDERFLQHRAPYEHPERPERLQAIWGRLEQEDLITGFDRVPARTATDDELLTVHTQALLRRVDATAGREFTQLDPDTYANRNTAEAARLAAGGLVDLARRVWAGELGGGLALLRPPGHHAEAGEAMGFCLFNNVAIATRAVELAGARRILIVDWDVHHGNGTQNTFWDDPRVLYFSIHQYPFYPGTGAITETGGDAAPGRTVNVPWPPGMGDSEYLAAFDRVLLPIATSFEPELILVSCGFDAAAGDLLGGMSVTPQGFAALTSRLEAISQGRVVLALEGGYNLEVMSRSAAACASVLSGREQNEPEARPPASSAAAVLDRVMRTHRAFWPVF